MKNTKIATFIFEGLGFPIKLIHVPLRKVYGEWVLDINLKQFQITVLHMLARKPTRLTGDELRFIRHFLEKSTRDFAKLFSVSHAALVKWENNETQMSFCTEVYVRLYILHYLKVNSKEFMSTFIDISPTSFADEDNETPLEIDLDNEHLLAC